MEERRLMSSPQTRSRRTCSRHRELCRRRSRGCLDQHHPPLPLYPVRAPLFLLSPALPRCKRPCSTSTPSTLFYSRSASCATRIILQTGPRSAEPVPRLARPFARQEVAVGSFAAAAKWRRQTAVSLCSSPTVRNGLRPSSLTFNTKELDSTKPANRLKSI